VEELRPLLAPGDVRLARRQLDRGGTHYPALSWTHNFAAAVRETALSLVPPAADAPLDIKLNAFGREIIPDADGVQLEFVVPQDDLLAGQRRRFARVVIASGFPMERPKYGALGGSYWRTPTDPASISAAGGVRIVGNGDGALTELITLGVAGFRQDHLRDLIDFVDEEAPDARDVGPRDRWRGLHAALENRPVAAELGGTATSFPLMVFCKDDKLTDRSFLLNACAAVAVEQAREVRGLGAVFEQPTAQEYGSKEADADRAAKRAIVWRVGPRASRHLIRDLGFPCIQGTNARDDCQRQWRSDFQDRLEQPAPPSRRPETTDTKVPEDGDELRHPPGGLLPIPGDPPPEYADVFPAACALAQVARTLNERAEALDRSAVRVLRDGVVHAAVDAVGAVASLPAAAVVDAWVAIGRQVRFADGCLFLRVEAADSSPDGEEFDTVARHVATDAIGIVTHLTTKGRAFGGAGSAPSVSGDEANRAGDDIEAYLDHEVLIEALMLAVRARRRRVTLPTAVLRRLQQRETPPGPPGAASRLLRLVAIALVPATAKSQGRVGLTLLGRACARQGWIRDDLAEFFFGRERGPEYARWLPAELMLDALRSIGSPLRGTEALKLTRYVLHLWVPAVAPIHGVPLVPGLEAYATLLGGPLRNLLKGDQQPGTDLMGRVNELLGELELAQRIAVDGGDGTVLRAFGLRVVPADAVPRPRPGRPRA